CLIRDDQIKLVRCRPEGVQSLYTAGVASHGITKTRQEFLPQIHQYGFVIHEQNMLVTPWDGFCHRRGTDCRASAARQIDGKGRTLAWRTHHGHGTPMTRYDPVCHRQAHPRSLSDAFGSEKGFINAFQNLRRHTVASIVDRQPHMRSWLEFRMRRREDRIPLDRL